MSSKSKPKPRGSSKKKSSKDAQKVSISVPETMSISDNDGDLAHEADSSEDEGDMSGRNTIGRVPLHWYDAYDHIGYSQDGNKVAKGTIGDRIDAAINERDDKASRSTVYDIYNNRKVVLSDREMELFNNIQQVKHLSYLSHDSPWNLLDWS